MSSNLTEAVAYLESCASTDDRVMPGKWAKALLDELQRYRREQLMLREQLELTQMRYLPPRGITKL